MPPVISAVRDCDARGCVWQFRQTEYSALSSSVSTTYERSDHAESYEGLPTFMLWNREDAAFGIDCRKS